MAVQEKVVVEKIGDLQNKTIIFFNGRISKGERKPWALMKGYTDKNGMHVSIKNCPLCEVTNDGKIVQMTMIDDKNEIKVSTYGRGISFDSSTSILKLNSITHFLVIQRLRDWHRTVSTQKTEQIGRDGKKFKPEVKHGWLIEDEPDVLAQKEVEEAMLKIDSYEALVYVIKNQYRRDIVAQAFNIYKEDNLLMSSEITKVAESKPKEFLNLFDITEKGNDKTFALKRRYLGPNMVKLAFKKDIIKRHPGSSSYMLDSDSLGTDLTQIPSLHEDRMAEIDTRLKKVYGIK